MDEKCMPFKDLIRKCGSKSLGKSGNWESPEGLLAQILLCDQMARNVFRRQPEAYWYDEVAEGSVERLLKDLGGVDGVVKHFSAAESMFVAVVLQHSEDLELHKQELAMWHMIGDMKPSCKPIMAEGLKQYKSHQDVLEMFGRCKLRPSG